MSSEIWARELDEPDQYIDQAMESEQFGNLLDEAQEHVELLDVSRTSAIELNDESGPLGTRVDVVYNVEDNGSSVGRALDVQSFYPVEETQETIGYLRIGNSLVKEFYTNEHIEQNCIVTEMDGDVYLEARPFELEGDLV